MNPTLLTALVLALALMVYLGFALLMPERFQ
jgi:K+-transporting ATPase KdpF subunit